MDHADLVAEMYTVENLPTQDRLHLARMRRAQQLKVARQKEKEWLKLQNRRDKSQQHSHKNRRHITFENSVVLLEAASRNDIGEVAHLLQIGITPNASNEDGLTALHQCCIDNNIEMLKLLLDYGANVDSQDSDKWTPLHAAATCGHLNLVKILINRGANVLAVNTDGNMPYDLCDDEETLDYIEAEMSKRGVTQELIDETRAQTEKQMLHDLMELASNDGDLEQPDYQGATPLHIAAANGYIRVVEFLLEHHVAVDAVDKDMWTPVHAAACWGHLEVLEMLAQYGADLNARNKDDETPSDICEDVEIRDRIELLKTEQESKKLLEAQRRRVRRSQSNNTRAQSVRRTSLRDKTLTTKKDAVEETRLRLQAQEVFTTPNNTIKINSMNGENTSHTEQIRYSSHSIPSSFSDVVLKKGSSNTINTNSLGRKGNITIKTVDSFSNHIKKSNNIQNDEYKNISNGRDFTSQNSTTSFNSRCPPEGEDCDEITLNDKIMIANSSKTLPNDHRTGEVYSTSKENGKINVQVTVLVDTHLENSLSGATLANLKKQRSQSRSNGISDNGSVIAATTQCISSSTSNENGQPIALTVIPSSSTNTVPTIPVNKFSGVTSDLVSDSTRSRKCCTLM